MQNRNRPHHKRSKFVNPFTTKRHKGMLHAFETFVLNGKPLPNYRKQRHLVEKVAPVLHYSGLSKGSLRATWLGHSTVLIEANGVRMLTDPVFEDTLGPVKGVGPKRSHPNTISAVQCLPIDLVIISHNHYDHLEARTVKLLKDKVKYWAVPLKVGRYLRNWGVAAQNIIELDWWQSFAIQTIDARVHCTPTQHFSGRWFWDRDTSLWCSWVVELGDHKIFFGGDTGYNAVQFREIGAKFGPIDLGLIPIGVYSPREFMEVVHVNSEESVKIHQEVGCLKSIGIHWGTFSLASEPIDEPPIKLQQAMLSADLDPAHFIALKIGESIIVNKKNIILD